MSLPQWIEAAETIDATLFVGDTFHDKHSKETLRKYLKRWEREIANLDEEEEAQESQLKTVLELFNNHPTVVNDGEVAHTVNDSNECVSIFSDKEYHIDYDDIRNCTIERDTLYIYCKHGGDIEVKFIDTNKSGIHFLTLDI